MFVALSGNLASPHEASPRGWRGPRLLMVAVTAALVALPFAGAVQANASSPPASASELRTDGANLDPSVDSVSATTSLSALRFWQFTLGNNQSTALNGAQVAVDTTGPCSPSPCPSLTATNPSTSQPEFGFAFSNPSVGGNLANGPGNTPCPAPASTLETCPGVGATVAPISRMTVYTSPNPQSGVPTSMTTGYDASRSLGTTGGGGDAPFALTVRLNDVRYTNATNNNQIFVNTFSDNVDAGQPLTVTANGSPVLQCPQAPGQACWQQLQVNSEQVPQQGGGTVTCNSAGLYLQQAQDLTTYVLGAQENENATGCPTGKPGVSVTATSQPPLSSLTTPCDVSTDCTTTVTDPTLGSVRFSVGPGQVNGFGTFQETNWALQFFPVAPAPTPQPPVFQDQRLDTANLDSSVDSVSAAAPLAQLRAWQFQAFNPACSSPPAFPFCSNTPYLNGSTSLSGAQAGVDTTTTCPPGSCSGPSLTATNPSNGQPEFTFSYANPQNGGGTGNTPCPPPAPTATQETCPTGGTTLAPSATMGVFTSPNPQNGVPLTETTGYNSSRALGATAGNGDAPATLSVQLVDSRFAGSGFDNQVFAQTFNDNVDASSPPVLTGNGSPVPSCPQPPGTACVQHLQIQSQTLPGGAVCNSVDAAIDHAQLTTQYTLSFEENETNANGCPSGKPSARITAQSQPPPSQAMPCTDNGTVCAATLTDPTLGAVSFAVASGQVNSIQMIQQPEYVVQYMSAPQRGTLTLTVPAPNPVAVNTPDPVAPSFTDSIQGGDSYTCSITWGDTSPPVVIAWPVNNPPGGPATCVSGPGQTAPPSHVYTAAGVYTVTVTINDSDGSMASASVLAVVYDPNAGFVTGGGWITSPPGAYVPSPSLTGRANFGFVSQYHTGANVPDGQTEFQFQLAGFDFHSDAYQWLVVSGAKAQYKGTGEVNGTSGYSFMLTALDGALLGNGSPDGFRIKIWQTSTGTLVYDNVLGSPDTLASGTEPLGGGSIVIHKT